MSEPIPYYNPNEVEEEHNITLSYSQVPLTKEGQRLLGANLAVAIAEHGDDEALPAYIKLKAMAEVLATAIAYLVDHAIDEADTRFAGEDTLNGVKFSIALGASKYDYSKDPTWQDLKTQEEKLKERIKKWQKNLQSLDRQVVDPETGEIIVPAEQQTMGNRQLRITFPKE